MSQAENAAATSLKPKQAYRKGRALTVSERKMLSVLRKKETHKAVNVYIKAELKNRLESICKLHGLTQAQAIEGLIEGTIKGE